MGPDEMTDALNTLLEDERASVELAIALASEATEYTERETLTAMGGADVEVCCLLRERLEHLEVPVSRRINGIVLHVLNLDRYDERLRTFARHQMEIVARTDTLLADEHLDGGIRDLLASLPQLHAEGAAWCARRADEFAVTRMPDFHAYLSAQGTGRRDIAAHIAAVLAPAGGRTAEAEELGPAALEAAAERALPEGEAPRGQIVEGQRTDTLADGPPEDDPE